VQLAPVVQRLSAKLPEKQLPEKTLPEK